MLVFVRSRWNYAVMEIYFQSHSTSRIYYEEEKCSSSKALKQKQSDLLGHMQKKS